MSNFKYYENAILKDCFKQLEYDTSPNGYGIPSGLEEYAGCNVHDDNVYEELTDNFANDYSIIEYLNDVLSGSVVKYTNYYGADIVKAIRTEVGYDNFESMMDRIGYNMNYDREDKEEMSDISYQLLYDNCMHDDSILITGNYWITRVSDKYVELVVEALSKMN